jgi:hypothetical protein
MGLVFLGRSGNPLFIAFVVQIVFRKGSAGRAFQKDEEDRNFGRIFT